MKQYLQMIDHVLKHGEFRDDRTGTGTMSVFGYQFRHDLSEGFPLLTTKRVPFRIVAEELKWFLSGSTNIKPLLDANVHIWDDDAYRWYRANYGEGAVLTKEGYIETIKNETHPMEIGDLGHVYGHQWRNWNGIDQVANAIDLIKNNPTSRRIIVNGWNVGELHLMALPPCHSMYQFYVSQDRKLSCQMYQRSADLFLGVPFNIASYSLLTHIIAEHCNLDVGEIIINFGDMHIYNNLLPQCLLQLQREPRQLPELVIRQDLTTLKDISDFEVSSLSVLGYDPHPTIKGKLSVGTGK